ncbi:LamG-like jellyroll fold domain-containing protein [Allorhodopirellula heiligendammensis]|uniref:FecR protein n=1 Tax=Allorhodopirellula heiligendammensis TaxID=2714739 RepID=A0A5C6BV61_9BACT|nr:LamG-like jellyroll fold domain-containing protein [Allorhodopirellula heiligendammensis]TWU15331.1 FecR protein [Allorhodopirellula heiligendammensis]
MDHEIHKLIYQAIDQTITPDNLERLQDAIEGSREVRLEYLRAVHLGETLEEIATSEMHSAVSSPEQVTSSLPADLLSPSRVNHGSRGFGLKTWASAKTTQPGDTFPPGSDTGNAEPNRLATGVLGFSWGPLVIAASIVAIISCVALWSGRTNTSDQAPRVSRWESSHGRAEESLIAGHATLRRSVDVQWSDNATSFHEGDVLPNGMLQFDGGLMEIDVFCGASLIVEGPASLRFESDWEVSLVKGRLRANVPPVARGFIVKAADSEIIDLGTEFALEVGADHARVEVLDGEVELRGGPHDGDHLVTGQGEWLTGSGTEAFALHGISSGEDLRRRLQQAQSQRFAEWQRFSEELSGDRRLMAYYPSAGSKSERIIRNAASASTARNGHLVGPVEHVSGRFGAQSTGLEFDRPGSRVRTRIDGKFQAFTFFAWVKIDSLDHIYNSLFLADGYENGEPHWQIRDDGRLMFSVMVDDKQDVRVANRFDKEIVRDAGRHHVYFTDPIWDATQSGQWLQLAAVYDPQRRRVEQYVNGQQVSSEEIVDDFYIADLRIGPAEIGNWGQPFRDSPWFAVRNLNGTIDELGIFNAALDASEILHLYDQGKPLGY